MAGVTRFRKFAREIVGQTIFLRLISLLFVLWLLFSAGLYLAERGADGTKLESYWDALYWGVAAFSTAGIADTPVANLAKLIGGLWIVVGSMLFFGAIVATVTAYFMRPLQRPARQIIETIEFNLEHLDQLSIEELDLLKATTDMLILHMEHLQQSRNLPEARQDTTDQSEKPV
jgi:voltage-gated potassium channel